MVAGQSGLPMAHVVSLVVKVLNSDSELVPTHHLNMVAVIVRVKQWTAGLVIPTSVQVRNSTTHYCSNAKAHAMIR